MFHIIKSIEPADNFILVVSFETSEKIEYDLKPLIDSVPEFAPLKKDINKYKNVQVDKGGYGISWSDNIDLSAEEIWNNGEQKCKKE